MKVKRIVFYIITLVLILSPCVVLAGTCTSTIVSGGGSSASPSTGGSSGCHSNACASINGGKYAGVRIRIYKYTGSGSSSNITAVGKAVDIWGVSSSSYLNYTAFRFSNPNTNNLKMKASCSSTSGSVAKSSIAYSKTKSEVYTLTASQYLSGSYGTVVIDSNVKNNYNAGTLDEYIDANDSSGWIYKNFTKKIKYLASHKTTASNYATYKSELKSLFGFSDGQISDMISSGDNYYIYAEVLYRWHDSTYQYLGTASEGSYFAGVPNVQRALYQDVSVGKLVSSSSDVNSSSKSYLIKKVSSSDLPSGSMSVTFNSGFSFPSSTTAAKTACNYGYGVNIWNLTTVCGDCDGGNLTCKETCTYSGSDTTQMYGQISCAKNYCVNNGYNTSNSKLKSCVSNCSYTCSDFCSTTNAGGDFESCAKDYCNHTTDSDSGYSSCVSSCVPQCDSVCGNYTDGTLARRVCAEAYCSVYDSDNSSCVSSCSTKNKVTGSACDEDDTQSTGNKCSSTMSDVTLSSSTSKTYTLNYITYLKVDCDEKLTISDLPTSNQKVFVNNNGSASLYLGYKTAYSKSCTLSYKKISSDDWMTHESGSILAYDNIEFVNIKNNTSLFKSRVSDSAVRTKMIELESTNDYYSKLNNYHNNASSYAKDATVPSTSSSQYITTKDTDGTEITITIEPMYCTYSSSYSSSKENYCDMQEIEVTSADYNIACDNDPEDSVTYNSSNNSYTYNATIYYSVGDSYVEARSSNAGKIYYSLKDCEKSSTGLCVAMPKSVTLTPIVASDGTTMSDYVKTLARQSYTLTIDNYGTCSMHYDLTCSYQYTSIEKCYACSDYTYGTSAYNSCYKTYCSCDAICGSNVACRVKYCPSICDTGECDDDPQTCEPNDPDDPDPPGKCQKTCESTYSSKEDEYRCKYNCCVNGSSNQKVTYSCCVDTCNSYYSANTDIDKCIDTYCICPNGECEKEYYYRTVNIDNPFPSGHTTGKNWSQSITGFSKLTNEAYITTKTEDVDSSSVLYDATDGRASSDDDYEYEIELTYDQIKQIKNQSTFDTTYAEYRNANKNASDTNSKDKVAVGKTSSGQDNDEEYCSYFLYKYLYSIGSEVKKSSKVVNPTTGSEVGCKKS